jgi:hypothetical protein
VVETLNERLEGVGDQEPGWALLASDLAVAV